MTDIPIIFSAPMIRAENEGRKTKTRRLLYSERRAKNGVIPARATMLEGYPQPRIDTTRHGLGTYWTLTGWHKVKPGDRLWVRETVKAVEKEGGRDGVLYLADDHWQGIEPTREAADKWLALATYRKGRGLPVPAIHMPRWASRLTLVVTATKIERLMAISDEDALKEGIVEDDGDTPGIFYVPGGWRMHVAHAGNPAMVFRNLWEALHGAESWNANPWVVALSFTVHKSNIDAMPAAKAA